MKTITLARGLPPLSIMRKLQPDLLEAFTKAANRDELSFLQYGNFAGYEPLREGIAQQFGVDRKRVFIGNGSMDTLHLFLQFLAASKEIGAYLCAQEVYDRPIAIAKAMGLSPQAIGLTEEGIDLAELEQALQIAPDKGVLYTIPWFDNPSGILHSEENVTAVSDLAHEHGWLTIRDGAYLDLSYFEQLTIPEVEDHVIQTFSWSKTITAGNHTGGIIIPERYADDFLYFISSWHLSPVIPTQMTAYELIMSGKWQQHMDENVVPDGKKRVEHFNALMKKHLPESAKREIRGGHFWGGKISGLSLENWNAFVDVALQKYGLKIPHHGGFMPLSPPAESAGYIRIPLFLEDEDGEDLLARITAGIAGARDAVV